MVIAKKIDILTDLKAQCFKALREARGFKPKYVVKAGDSVSTTLNNQTGVH
ncbi:MULTISPECIES: hypothetical protein [unclassified Nostoc]|uniref:hypothetical protein n=1 Tax=unclassified Nostoc TaxID=2593658 RepID=UPI0025AB04EE|nr:MULTISPECIES: hypothetical protein [unclassified Nostoc]MDM9581377.1 hypothetical protein [Nostoc sp. GT001]MDZ7948994.1 hypothetical protein [Nostoc sp. EfeVER01]